MVNSYSVDLMRKRTVKISTTIIIINFSILTFLFSFFLFRMFFQNLEKKGSATVVATAVQFRFISQSPVTPSGGGGDWPSTQYLWESRNVSTGLMSDFFLNCQFSVVINVKVGSPSVAYLGNYILFAHTKKKQINFFVKILTSFSQKMLLELI